MSDKSERRNRNWIGWASLLIAVYFVALISMVGPRSIWDFFTETVSLNNIGDFLAGFFAFPAFLLLGAAVLTQRQELGHAMDQFADNKRVIQKQIDLIKDQNDLSHRAAEANYQLALFDKRLEVYSELRKVVSELYINGTNPSDASKLIPLLDKAEFTCSVKNDDWIVRGSRAVRDYIFFDAKVERLRKRQETATDRNIEKISSDLDVARKACSESEDWIDENLTWEKLDAYFKPLLVLPDRLLDQRKISGMAGEEKGTGEG